MWSIKGVEVFGVGGFSRQMSNGDEAMKLCLSLPTSQSHLHHDRRIGA